MKPLILAGLAVPALVATAPAMQSMHGPHAAMHDHLRGMLVQKLNLTPEQQEAIQKVVAAHREALHGKGLSLVKLRAELADALLDPPTTEEQIRDLEARGSAADLAFELEVSQVVKEVNPILTDDQRLKAKQLKSDLHHHAAGFLAGLHAGRQDAPQHLP